jgi:hypothetical protein
MSAAKLCRFNGAAYEIDHSLTIGRTSAGLDGRSGSGWAVIHQLSYEPENDKGILDPVRQLTGQHDCVATMPAFDFGRHAALPPSSHCSSMPTSLSSGGRLSGPYPRRFGAQERFISIASHRGDALLLTRQPHGKSGCLRHLGFHRRLRCLDHCCRPTIWRTRRVDLPWSHSHSHRASERLLGHLEHLRRG